MGLAIPGEIKSIELRRNGLVGMAKVNFRSISIDASLEMLHAAAGSDYELVQVVVV